MDSLHQPLNIAEYNSLITNIIESAVDELIQKRECAGGSLGYDDAAGQESLLFHICRLCAREETLLLDLSDLHLVLMNELAIAGIEGSAGCTKICSVCAEFLGRIREFRCKCEDAQKRISSLLAERSVISDFLNLDFSKAEEHYGGFSPPPPDVSDIGDVPDVDDVDFEPNVPITVTEGPEEEEPLKLVLEPAKSESVELEPAKQIAIDKVLATVKKTKKVTDSRRRVVNGKLQWICLDCDQIFESCTKLKKHRQSCELVGNENSKRLGPFTCEICGQSLPTVMGLRVHMHKHNKAGSESEKKSKASPAVQVVSKLAVCHVCGKSFGSMSSLRRHLVFHGQEKRVECHICNKKFYKLYRLKDHLNCHSNVRRYSCQVCGKAFFTKGILYKHTRTHDQNFRKHQCPMCPMRFAHPYQLRSHVMIHTAEYPHGCKICQSKFRFSWDLKKHYIKVHPPVPEEDDPPSPAPILEEDHHLDDIVPPGLLDSPPHLPLSPLPLLADPTAGLIEEEHHDDLSVMLADIPPHHQPELTPSVAAIQPVIAEHPFDTENLLEEASREFTADCFPADHLDNSHTAEDDDFYTFMEC